MTETTEGIRKAASNLGLVMSFKKTEIMQLIIIQIKKKKGNIKVVDYLKYLGAYSNSDETSTKELNYRVGHELFRELVKVGKNRYINLRFSFAMHASCLRP